MNGVHNKHTGYQDKTKPVTGFTVGYKKCHTGTVMVHLDKVNNLEVYGGGSSRDVKLLEGAIHIDLANIWKPVLSSNCGFALKYARKYDFINLGWKDYDAGSLEKAEWDELITFLKKRGKASKEPQKVVVACLGGHGRTGSCLSTLAGLLGWTKADPVEWIRKHYCDKAVESDKQIAQIEAFTGLKVTAKAAKEPFLGGGVTAFTKQGERYAIPDDDICQDPTCKHRGYTHSQMSGSCLITACNCRMFDMGGVDYKPPTEEVDAQARDYTAINESGGLVKCVAELRSEIQPKPAKVKPRHSAKGKALAASTTIPPVQQAAAYHGKDSNKLCVCNHARYMHKAFGTGGCYSSQCSCPSFLAAAVMSKDIDVEDTTLDPTLQDLPVSFDSFTYWWCPHCLCAVTKPFQCGHCSKTRAFYQMQASALLTEGR